MGVKRLTDDECRAAVLERIETLHRQGTPLPGRSHVLTYLRGAHPDRFRGALDGLIAAGVIRLVEVKRPDLAYRRAPFFGLAIVPPDERPAPSDVPPLPLPMRARVRATNDAELRARVLGTLNLLVLGGGRVTRIGLIDACRGASRERVRRTVAALIDDGTIVIRGAAASASAGEARP